MTVTELLETVRRVELRTNRLVNGTMVGACLSRFKRQGRGFRGALIAESKRTKLANRTVAFEFNQR
jgi:hypothetical protein